jgi:hypothetical protein
LIGKHVDRSFAVVSNHFVQKAFEGVDKWFWGIRSRSSAEGRMRVILNDEFGKFAGRTPEGLLCNKQCCFNASHSRTRRKEIAIYHYPTAAGNSF